MYPIYNIMLFVTNPCNFVCQFEINKYINKFGKKKRKWKEIDVTYCGREAKKSDKSIHHNLFDQHTL